MLFNNRIHIVEPTITEGFGSKFSIISQGRRIWLQVQYYQSRQKDLAARSVLSVTIKGFGCKFSIISQDRRIWQRYQTRQKDLAAISVTIEGFGCNFSIISHDRRIWLQVQYYQSRQSLTNTNTTHYSDLSCHTLTYYKSDP